MGHTTGVAVENEPTVVLLVEDDEDDYYLTKTYLESGGAAAGVRFSLSWCQTLADAQASLASEQPGVILVDLNLPDSTGWNTFEGIHMQAPDVAVIILTGLADDELGMKAVKRGAQDYLSKGDVDGGKLVRAIRYSVDRKAAETDLRRYQDHLEELVRHRTERIRETNRELRQENEERRRAEQGLRDALSRLEQHDKAKSRFVSNVSHELKTPLASMSYAIENLLRGIVGPVSKSFRSYLEMLNDDCQRLIRTVSDILDLSRIEADSLRLNRSKVAFRHFVEHSVGSMTMLAAQKEVDLEIRYEDSAGFIECDAHKMERVILNVVQNALKFTPSGGHVDIVIRRGGSENECMVLDVRDTGIGIPQEHIGHVTERYFRIGEQISGSGLGLAISKELLELHGGHIDIQSPPPGADSGTQVSLFMPVVPSPRVLVAMGDEPWAARLADFMTGEGYEVDLCHDGPTSLNRLQAQTPNAVIMDFQLPEMDGVELLAQIKADFHWLHLPVVVAVKGEIDVMKQELIEGFRLPTVRDDVDKTRLLRILNQAMIEQPLRDDVGESKGEELADDG